ncbi:bifunctional UDP-N-acetylglucosamine diphosphorylase/glucosamine-1-phosphate N-acetyltransferase GlmU [Bacillus sp. HMF5848]|uniref:bifunctional UDP-N-acetylglucosamine diphosphorylase/glucosamine-1-phosphate N-acetyltransferase GlmU n=1 Tax=Bacillus sp. HMF5848 TaxID=2495421 RepID=UPI000F77A1AF|nr:bifunctional UDP-N-acetylglucosamine diphosphorylase/glucosamine-1-phosphate N-acetyltransferase GlmU [Bacillus sp. HMF5848]RSK25484.1 bifunctional UDP-N-acetylglucosamine diphosphorylase/glucosamine-1-phosphate N-acetyltransferase GlmU [Bacillus sp. HMF5848]
MSNNRYAVVLAAGQGTRMKSKLYKVLHPVCGKPMVEHVVDQLQQIGLSEIVTVVGHGAEVVKAQLQGKSEFVLQNEQLGTAHAVMQASDLLKNESGTTLVVCGDTPLLTKETLQSLLDHHGKQEAKVTVLTASAFDPTGYGRVVRTTSGDLQKIVEHKDATEQEREICEINTGTYCFDNEALFQALEQVSNDNVQGEYYLPDVIEILQQAGEKVTAFMTQNFDETMGVNDRYALSQAEAIMRARIAKKHMLQGVTIVDPENTYIDSNVFIGQDTIIYPGTVLKGNVEIGEECTIGPNSEISNCKIGNHTDIRHSVATDSEIGSDVAIGPFAHIRPSSSISDDVKIGNFVEVKKASFGKGSKASHLSYIGDSSVGQSVNIGCGTITVNYDGKNKYKTVIEDNAFIGCNSNLIAPVTIGTGAYVAAGSTITDDVPADALSIGRARQVNKEEYAKKIKE